MTALIVFEAVIFALMYLCVGILLGRGVRRGVSGFGAGVAGATWPLVIALAVVLAVIRAAWCAAGPESDAANEAYDTGSVVRPRKGWVE